MRLDGFFTRYTPRQDGMFVMAITATFETGNDATRKTLEFDYVPDAHTLQRLKELEAAIRKDILDILDIGYEEDT